MKNEEPDYTSYRCKYSTAPCEKCPYVLCKDDYPSVRSFIARERRKNFRELRLKGVSVAMIANVCGQSNKWVRDSMRGL